MNSEVDQTSLCISLPGCKPELQMMYAGSKNSLVSDGGFTKVGWDV